MTLASEALHNGALSEVEERLVRHKPRKRRTDPRGFEWRYLAEAINQSNLVTHQLTGLGGASFFRDAEIVIAGQTLYNVQDGGHQIKAWDLATWQELPLERPKTKADAVWRWHPAQEGAVVQNDHDHQLVVYRLPRFEAVAVLSVPGTPGALALAPGLRDLALEVGEADLRRVLVWNLITRSFRTAFEEQTARVIDLEFSPAADVLLCRWDNGRSGLWSLAESKPLPTSRWSAPVPDADSRLFFALNASRLFAYCDESSKVLQVWDWSTEMSVKTTYQTTGSLSAYGFSSDGSILAAVFGEIAIFDAKDLRLLSTMSGHATLISQVAFSPSGSLLVTASRDHTAKLWDVKTHRELQTLGGNEEKVSGVAFTPDGKSVVTLSGDGQLKVWDLNAVLGRDVLLPTADMPSGAGAFLSPDQQVAASHDPEGNLHLWDLVQRKETMKLPIGESRCSISFSPTAPMLAWAVSRSFGLLNYRSGQTNIFPLAGNTPGIQATEFSPDGRQVAFRNGSKITFCTVANPKLRPFASCDMDALYFSFSPNGALLASAHDGGRVCLWEVATGHRVTDILAHPPAALDVRFSPDGRLLATAGSDATGKIWELGPQGLKLRHVLRGHLGYVSTIYFSPDGKRVISGSGDKTLKIWDPETGMALATLYGHNDLIWGIWSSPDGNTLYSTADNLRAWPAPPLDRFEGRSGAARAKRLRAYPSFNARKEEH